MYLYTVSLLILLYFQIGLLRGVKVKTSYFEPTIKISVRQDGSIQKSTSPTSTPTPHRAHEVLNDVSIENGQGEEISLASRHSQLVLPIDGGVAHVGEGINFYLRLGALGMLGSILFLFQIPGMDLSRFDAVKKYISEKFTINFSDDERERVSYFLPRS